MRVALVCPYSWSYPGGVTRHVEALSEQLIGLGHDVTVLAPLDPPDRRASLLHWASPPQEVVAPDYLLPLGRTIGIPANGSVSNLLVSPRGIVTLARSLRAGAYDVVHVHEPDAPPVGWVAMYASGAPLVGTFHTYNEHRWSHALAACLGVRLVLNRLHVRVAVSSAAEWTARRFFGGRYRIVPNGVQVDPQPTPKPAPPVTGDPLRIVFVGQPVARKGLPVLLRAFEALRERIPCELTLVGPGPEDVEPFLLDGRDVRALGKVDDTRKRVEVAHADVLCAPSMHGESFGMVLTEAFAVGTPVVASDIPGYRDLVRAGTDGLLVPAGDAQALASALYGLWQDPARRAAMGARAAADVGRFAWPEVTDALLDAYRDAVAVPAPATARARTAVRLGLRSADLGPRAPARRLTTLERPAPDRPRKRSGRRRALSVVVLLALGGLCWLAARKIDLHAVTTTLSRTNAAWVAAGVAIMCAAMALRAVSWYAALHVALPRSGIRLLDAVRGLFIGVLVSSTLPANLGEPSRALVVARRTERPWRALPIVAGTVVSQSLLNVVAVVVLGAIVLGSVDLGRDVREGLAAGAGAAALALAIVLGAPTLLRRARGSRLASIQAVAARLRSGLAVFGRPRPAAGMVIAQMSAWALQCLAVDALLVATHLSAEAGLLAAAAVLCAVNVTLLFPATPGDIGVFQAAVAAVLHAGWHVGYGDGVAFGLVLQAAELVTALLMGIPALLGEGLSWRHLGVQARTGDPITLPPPVPADQSVTTG